MALVFVVLFALAGWGAWLWEASERRWVQSRYDSLLHEYNKLYASYSELEKSYSDLCAKHKKLESEYKVLFSKMISLNKSISVIIEEISKLTNLKRSLEKVLTYSELRSVLSTVLEITGHSRLFWNSLYKLYTWVRLNIGYVSDNPYPVVYVSSITRIGQQRLVSSLSFSYVKEYVQSPSLTLKRKYGDCEDQAILLYAMIIAYEEFIYGRVYLLYLVIITTNDGSRHATVFLPVKGGKVTILDPAGGYLTSSFGYIASRSAREELLRYSRYWKGIKWLVFYRIHVGQLKSTCYKVFEGNLYQAIDFLSRT